MNFFDVSHYEAFLPTKASLDDASTRAEREKVRDRLLQLDEPIWSFISAHSWDLHRHRQKEHYTSSYHFVYTEDHTPIMNYIDGMWLHYGKSPQQLDFVKSIGGYDYKGFDDNEYYNAFYLHTRIQVYINRNIVRCWLLLATDKNYYDRSEFLRGLVTDNRRKDRFIELVHEILDKGFFYEVGESRFLLSTPLDESKLLKFVKSDKPGLYSGIAKEYQNDAQELEDVNIVAEMQKGIELLYPMYDFMAWRPGRTP